MVIPFIAVEGPIGVGKTSLTEALAQEFDYVALHEIVDENPFLNKFYENIEEWSFQTEMFFLCNRYKQLGDIQKHTLSENRPVVADYHIFKNLIFAKRTLQEEEYEKYAEIYRILTRDVPMPNIIVYLTASLEKLQERIELRGRTFEQQIDPNYLVQLTEDYAQFMEDFERVHPEVPVLRFDGDAFDFVHSEADRAHIVREVKKVLEEMK
ncbi:deoxynucleoside kinase [Savagea sp. SN6]|uniref:Deoxynucleoside kinase n=1 Tax=Savagea serpentis TaxID=2785297 RepID=A0A8J7G760_9BACL|nr:deoxynucleoside kinase [Savagea serpentis]MBF4501586.1 deoxynucleoside kinase [Savagea serpentis]